MMKWLSCVTKILMVFALFYLIFPKEAYAYLDPGTCSYVLQIIIAVLIGAVLSIKIGWGKIRTFFANIFPKRQKGGKDRG